MMTSARAQHSGSTDVSPAARIHFALPAEPLVDAIKAYGQTADVAVLVDSGALAGRSSEPLNGDFAPREALQRLLAGTGLQARFTRADEAVIQPVPSTSAVQPPAPLAQGPSPLIFASDVAGLTTAGRDADAYAVLLQTRLTEALCETPWTRPGAYRLLMQLTIGSSGAVATARLLGSTGSPARDAAIENVMYTVTLDSGPPAALQQPVTILLRPQGNGVGAVCELPAGQD